MVIFTLEELDQVLETFSPAQCAVFAEYCITALEYNEHYSGCSLLVLGHEEKEIIIFWNKKFLRAGYREKRKITEKAAETISFFLVKEMSEFSVVLEATIGTGFDYWLGYDEEHRLYDPLNFMKARLEISGINKETRDNTVKKRVEEKRSQVKVSDSTNLPAYISVVELFTPKAAFEKK